MKDKIKKNIKENKILYLLLIISCVFNFLVFYQLGYSYTLGSDDLSYVNSGIQFLESGKITIHNYDKTAQIMPGMPILISFFACIFGKGGLLWLSLKLFWIFMAELSIYGLYKIIRFFGNDIIAGIVTCFLLTTDFLWMNNLILTETPFMLSFIFLIYHTLKLGKTKEWKDFWWIVFWYIFGIMIRPNIGIYPLFLFFYLLLKKYDFKLLIKQGIIAAGIVSLFLIPWTIRNYKVFHKFIPLTYGTGNPLLLGTYQGHDYPLDEELDYKKNVDDKLPIEMKKYLFGKESNKLSPLNQYYALEYDGIKAKYRMKEWWEKNPRAMLKSYMIYKPKIMLTSTFYWKEVLKVPKEWNLFIRNVELILTLCSLIIVVILKKYWKETLLLITTYMFQIALYSYTFSFDRYAQTLYFIQFIIIGIGISIIWNKYKERKLKNEIIT